MASPLEGVKVLDLARGGPGPYCTMVLGDLGAEVLQIEQPGGGRRARRREGAPGEAEREERRDAAFNVVARNKKSMTLDLRSPEARRILYSLVEGADVLVETNRPGVMKRLGADYDSLKETNPRLIYCSITGYGQSGPYHDLPGHDLNFNAVGGALILSRKDGGAAVPLSLVGYFTSRAVVAVVGILAALLAREKTGRGQHVDIALTDASLYLVARLVSDYLSHGVIPRAGGADLSGSERPFYTVYEAQDGKYLSVGGAEPQFADNLMRALGRAEWIGRSDDEKLYPAMSEFLRKTFKTRSRDEWFDYLSQRDVAVARVNTIEDVIADPQILHRGMMVDAGTFEGQAITQVGIGIGLTETPGTIRRIGTVRGQHTVEVLTGLGYSPEEVRGLRQRGVIE